MVIHQHTQQYQSPAAVYINNGREMKMSAADQLFLKKACLPAVSSAKLEITRTPCCHVRCGVASGGIVNIVLKKGVSVRYNR